MCGGLDAVGRLGRLCQYCTRACRRGNYQRLASIEFAVILGFRIGHDVSLESLMSTARIGQLRRISWVLIISCIGRDAASLRFRQQSPACGLPWRASSMGNGGMIGPVRGVRRWSFVFANELRKCGLALVNAERGFCRGFLKIAEVRRNWEGLSHVALARLRQ